jgi:hypothetical protein
MKGCALLFKFRVLEGQEAAYAAYLEGPVATIDAAAHKADAFIELVTIRPQDASTWNHGRLFLFRDHAQREAFAARMAQASLVFDGSEAARAQRKAYAETLRRQIAVSDYELD